MISFLTSAINSPIILTLTVIYFISASITTFDARMIQAQREGRLKKDDVIPPAWTAVFIFIGWGVFIAILFINWQFAIMILIIKFVLKVLPVLETIGNIILSPFRSK